MNKNKSLLKFLIATVTTVGLISGISISASAADIPLYEFDVISDTHIGATDNWNASDKFEKTLNSIKTSYPNSQCIVINGDVVDNSQQINYTKLSDCITRNKKDLPFIYFNLGNHEFATQTSPYTMGTYTNGLARFNSNVNSIQSNLRTKQWITKDKRYSSYDVQYINGKNSRLLFLGTDELRSSYTSFSYLSNNQLSFLANQIQANTTEGKGKKPMFIFSHQPVYETTYGSNFAEWGYIDKNNSNFIKGQLSGHREIIMFTGHTHKEFTKNDQWLSENFDSKNQIFSVPSIAENPNGPQGYHVKVYSSWVIVEGVQYLGNGCKTLSWRTIEF